MNLFFFLWFTREGHQNMKGELFTGLHRACCYILWCAADLIWLIKSCIDAYRCVFALLKVSVVSTVRRPTRLCVPNLWLMTTTSLISTSERWRHWRSCICVNSSLTRSCCSESRLFKFMLQEYSLDIKACSIIYILYLWGKLWFSSGDSLFLLWAWQHLVYAIALEHLWTDKGKTITQRQ